MITTSPDQPLFGRRSIPVGALVGATALLAGLTATAVEPIPKVADTFLVNYCLDCHDADTEKGDLNLDFMEIDWTDPHAAVTWAKVFDALEAGDMPPENKEQPESTERQAMLAWLDESLTKFDRPGGTVIRRLNRTEYESSVRAALGIPFEVPKGFPDDPEFHGFDNIGEGLILSPPLMQKYFELAGLAADLILPPEKGEVTIEPETNEILPDDLSMAFDGVQLRDDVMRLVTRSDILIRSCSWPTRFEANHTGTYSIKTRLSALGPESDTPLRVDLLVVRPSMTFTQTGPLPRVAVFEVPADGKVHELSAKFDLEKGQTVSFHWANAALGAPKADGVEAVGKQNRELLLANPKLHAAWLAVGGFERGQPMRGRTPNEIWKMVKEKMESDELDLEDPRLEALPSDAALGRNGIVGVLKSMHMERGPALDIHSATFFGPTELKESRAERDQRLRAARFLGEREGRNDEEYAEAILRPFLEKAFRRPVSKDQLQDYLDIAKRHWKGGNRFEDGIHLAIRAALCSTNFLFRGQREGALDDYDLASRLSYFLASAPPDSRLMKLAGEGSLSDPDVLETESRRLLSDNRSRLFLESFLGQWLDLDLLPDIMPDERLLKFLPQHLQAITEETHLFVSEILRENHPIETFVDPDFTYLNRRNAQLYGMKVDGDDMQRVSLERGHRHGGILGQASVMMATANGVDTQPVLRGVWLLENIFGDPPPELPSSVPAIEPDTTGANSIRELLDRHKADASCAGCHLKIDPPGFALENFDPVGRWREYYPVYEKDAEGKVITKNGQAVDSASELEDGTPLKDVTDLKRYLVANIDLFSDCLAEKLLVYATGRPLSFGDRKEVDRIVADVKAKGNGFQDLIVEVVLSESFRTK